VQGNLLIDSQIPILQDYRCSDYDSFYEEDDICAGWNDGRYDLSKINIGAPLICKPEDGKTKWLLTGIFQGHQNRKENSFGIYTDIGVHYDWIIEKTSTCAINYGKSTCLLIKYGETLFKKDTKLSERGELGDYIDSLYLSVDKPGMA
jgi:secreted trypsin-like serine protease